MKKVYFSVFLILQSFILMYSQHVIKDSLSIENIPFVEVYSENGDLIGLTDNEGRISTELENKIFLSNSKKITFSHSTYKNRETSFELFKNTPFISLSPFYHELKEVIILPRPKNYKYLKLKGYFRSIQINEDKPQYFIDGIVEYYVPMKSGKIKMRMLSNRSFKNNSIKQISSSLHFLVAGVPLFNDFTKYKNLINEYDFKNSGNESIKIIDKNNNKQKGVITNSNNESVLQLEIISKSDPKIMKFLGIESNLNNYTINSIYNNNDSTKMDLDNLIYCKEIRDYTIKRKNDEKYTRIEATHEFFLIDKEYVDEIGSKALDSFYTFKSPSNYTENYWENVDNKLFQSLPKSLELYIQENLTDIKK